MTQRHHMVAADSANKLQYWVKNDTLKAAVIHPGRYTGNDFYLFKTTYEIPPSLRKLTLYIM